LYLLSLDVFECDQVQRTEGSGELIRADPPVHQPAAVGAATDQIAIGRCSRLEGCDLARRLPRQPARHAIDLPAQQWLAGLLPAGEKRLQDAAVDELGDMIVDRLQPLLGPLPDGLRGDVEKSADVSVGIADVSADQPEVVESAHAR